MGIRKSEQYLYEEATSRTLTDCLSKLHINEDEKEEIKIKRDLILFGKAHIIIMWDGKDIIIKHMEQK